MSYFSGVDDFESWFHNMEAGCSDVSNRPGTSSVAFMLRCRYGFIADEDLLRGGRGVDGSFFVIEAALAPCWAILEATCSFGSVIDNNTRPSIN